MTLIGERCSRGFSAKCWSATVCFAPSALVAALSRSLDPAYMLRRPATDQSLGRQAPCLHCAAAALTFATDT